MKKKALALLLALVLCLGLGFVAVAAETETALSTGWRVEEVTPTQYDDVGGDWFLRTVFRGGLAAVKRDGKWGFVDATGQEVIPCKYDHAKDFSEGLAAVKLDGKWGFVDKTDAEIIPCKYDDARDFFEGLAEVWLDGKKGLIDQTGAEVVPCKYYDVAAFSENLAAVDLDGSWGFVDKTGTEVVPCKYYDVAAFSENLAAVKLDGKWGFVDKTGAEVIPCRYDDAAEAFSEGLAAVKLDGKWGFVDKTGTEVVPCKYDNVAAFFEGLAAVRLDGKWGFVDKIGAEVIPCRYDDAWNFSEGLAMVELDGKCGFIDKAGATAIPFQYSPEEVYGWFEGFSNGAAVVGYQVDSEETFDGWNSLIVINKAGEQIIPGRYFRIYDYGRYNDQPCIRVGRAYDMIDEDGPGGGVHSCKEVAGIYTATGKEIIPCKYPALEITLSTPTFVGFSDSEAELIRVAGEDQNKEYVFGFIDREGNEAIPFMFTDATEMYHSVFFGQMDGKWKLYTANEPGGNTEPSTPPVAVTGVELNRTQVSLKENESAVLTAAVKPANADNKGVYWTSSDTAVLSVSDTGKLTARKEGTATVTVTTLDGGFTDACMVTVTKASGGSSSGGGSGSGGPSGGGSSSGGSGDGASTPAPIPAATKSASEKFTDVVKDSWYEAGVTYVTDKGLFQGVADGVFAPNANMTRAMLMTVLARLDGQSTEGGDTWYAKGMDWAVATGVSDGTMPERSVTREQLVTMLYRYAKPSATAGDLTAFVDGGGVSAWAVDAMTWAVSQGIVTGKDGTRLDPQGTATRAEVATIIQRFVENK